MSTLQEAMVKARVLENKTDAVVCPTGDAFLSLDELVPVARDAAKRTLNLALSEAEELMSEKKWEDMVALFRPVEEKQPELVAHGLDTKIRAKVAFALGQLNRFDEAIEELSICIQKEPQNFVFQSSLGYTAYNSLFAAANREIFLRGQARRERIDLAHRHLRKAQELHPDGVTNYYRQGMLFKNLERKVEKGLPLFERAVSNWDALDEKQQQYRHQERKNFVKALYQNASCLLTQGAAKQSLNLTKRCIAVDEKSNYVSLVFKYFALGKVHFQMNQFSEARDALLFAAKCKTNENDDFVYELLGRTYLGLNIPSRALETINRVPEKKRRPYYRWTEADIYCALKQFDRAKAVLNKARERDNRSGHKALIRLAKIDYAMGNFSSSMKYAAEAGRFFEEKWGNRFYEGMFWEALGAYRAGEHEKALTLAMELKAHNPNYPKLDILLSRIAPSKGDTP